MSNYTQYIEDHYWSNTVSMQRETKAMLQSMPINDAQTELPMAIEQFWIDYTCSARRYLMNYFQRHATAILPNLGQFSYTHRGKVYLFQMVESDSARTLEAEERDTYIKLICEIAADNSGDTEKDWRPLVRKAMLWNKQLELLTKEEAFRIGHGLRFTVEEMDDFLLRVLDNDGLSYTRSEDVIEAFCFLYEPANDWRVAEKLKAEYHAVANKIAKQPTRLRSDGFTVKVERSLQSCVERWQAKGEDVTGEFKQWLLERAPYLDVPSRSAWYVYCRLAELAYRFTLNPELIIDESAFSDTLIQACSQADDDVPDEHLAYQMTAAILNTAALEFDNARKRQPNQVWRYLTVDTKGRMTAVAIGTRIPQLLLGIEPVAKADILFMIWYIGDLCWTESTKSGRVVFDRTADFWTVSETLLEKAHLPGFYAPHMLERCFLKAICTQSGEEAYPFEVYEGMCEFVLPDKQVRNRSKQGSRVEISRAQLEKETQEAYAADRIYFEGLAEPLFAHFMEHGAEKGKYVFAPEGVSYLPDPRIAVTFPEQTTGKRFDLTAETYMGPDTVQERFRFVYGLALCLQEHALECGIRCDFRTNYQKNVSLTILQWEEQRNI